METVSPVLTQSSSDLAHTSADDALVIDHYESVEVQKSRQVFDHYEVYYTYDMDEAGSFREVVHERPVYITEQYTEIEQRPVYRKIKLD